MNQQMYLLEARAVAREREHPPRPSRRDHAVRHRPEHRVDTRSRSLRSLGRRLAAQGAVRRRTRVAAARG